MRYLTHDEYLKIGGVLDLTAFNRIIDRACCIIDNATYMRISKMKDIPVQVKTLCREIVEYIFYNMTAQNMITSKSQASGPISESESYAIKTKEEQNQDIDNLITDYLISLADDVGTPLLYRGCIV